MRWTWAPSLKWIIEWMSEWVAEWLSGWGVKEWVYSSRQHLIFSISQTAATLTQGRTSLLFLVRSVFLSSSSSFTPSVLLFFHASTQPHTHLSAHSLIHTPTHPPIHPFIHSSTHPPIHPLIHSLIHPLIHSSTNPSTHPSTHPLTHPFTHPSTHPPIHPPTNPLSRSSTCRCFHGKTAQSGITYSDLFSTKNTSPLSPAAPHFRFPVLPPFPLLCRNFTFFHFLFLPSFHPKKLRCAGRKKVHNNYEY